MSLRVYPRPSLREQVFFEAAAAAPLAADSTKSAPVHTVDGINIFPGKNVGSAPGRGAGKGRGPGVARRVIFFRRAFLTSILSISTFSRVSYRSTVSFSIYPRLLLSHFSFSPLSPPPSPVLQDGRNREVRRRRMDSREIQQIKRKFVSPRGRSLRVGGPGKGTD